MSELINEEILVHCSEFSQKLALRFLPGNIGSPISMTTKQLIDLFEQEYDYRPDASTFKTAMKLSNFVSVPDVRDGEITLRYYFEEN